MMLGLDLGSLLIMVAVVLIIFLAVDLLAAGGGMTAGMMTGMAGMMSTPWGWGGLALVLVLVLLAMVVGR